MRVQDTMNRIFGNILRMTRRYVVIFAAVTLFLAKTTAYYREKRRANGV